MAKYRSKPAEVEAELVGTEDDVERIAQWCGGEQRWVIVGRHINHDSDGRVIDIDEDASVPVVMVHTNNGDAFAHVGDYVVKGVADFYPCDPVTFEARWELIEEPVHYARNGAIMACGCWYYAMPGDHAGVFSQPPTRAKCPLHGETHIVDTNIAEPFDSDATWIALPDREPQPGDGPEYHADHAAWEERQRRHRGCSFPDCDEMERHLHDHGVTRIY